MVGGRATSGRTFTRLLVSFGRFSVSEGGRGGLPVAEQRRRSDEIVRSARVVFPAHRRRALASAEQVRNEEIAVRVFLPQATVGVLVTNLADLGR